MSHGGQENQGTGLRDVFDILVKAPRERLLSLTFQLGESPEDDIIHALCLLVLQREAQALDKLQTLRDNYVAKHVVEKWQMSGGKLEEFGDHCGHFQELTGESLAALARIFKVLSEQRLCDQFLRNLAYKRAVSSDIQNQSIEALGYDLLREEAKLVCGPEIAEWMSSPMDLKSGSDHDPHSGPDEGNATLKVTLSPDQSKTAQCLPSPLQASSSMPSYPTHLEISAPSTASFQNNNITPETSDESKPNVLLVSECQANNASVHSQTSHESNEPSLFEKEHSLMGETLAMESSKLDSLITQNETPTQTTKPATEPNFALPSPTILLPKMPITNEMHESYAEEEEEEEDEEATFYAFVILHAPEDADMAESMRDKLEKASGSLGATFSEDFAVPGKSTLKCVEDAINNSAFTLLLLTHNFNTRMLEVKTNIALINSINNKHKYNTVIPLLPRENSMPRASIPIVLQTIVPLEEKRSFEKKARNTLSPLKIKKQKAIWSDEQTVKSEKVKQERLKHSNEHQKQLLKESKATQLLETENLGLLMAKKFLLGPGVPQQQDGGDGTLCQLQQRNIHIEHANYIMIGNDSKMTVGLGGGSDKEEEQ